MDVLNSHFQYNSTMATEFHETINGFISEFRSNNNSIVEYINKY